MRIDVKMLSIYLEPGSQLTFRTWLGLQPAFWGVDLDAEIGDWADDLLGRGEADEERLAKSLAVENFLNPLSM
jgi:hypothetical protein